MSTIKQEVSYILQSALSGQDATLRHEGYIRWGLVEKRIHTALDTLIAERDALRKALEPFSEIAGFSAYNSKPEGEWVNIQCSVRDLRRAHAALHGTVDIGNPISKPRTCGECVHFLSAAEIDCDVCTSEDGKTPTYTYAANDSAAKCRSFQPRAAVAEADGKEGEK